jgi:hypothetical protein
MFTSKIKEPSVEELPAETTETPWNY